MAESFGSDQLAVARLKVAKSHPYYATVLWAFQPVPVKDFKNMAPGPMGVDKHLRLYYDPETIGSWSVETLAAVLQHEIGHVLRAHATRCNGRHPLPWNIAGDCEINDDLKVEGVPLPEWVVYPKTIGAPDNLMAEEYYERMKQDAKGSGKGAGGGECGSIADGEAKQYEEPAEGNSKTPAGISEAGQELLRQKVAQDVEAHVKSRGDAPAWLKRWAAERLRAKVDWRKMLAAYIRRAVGDIKGAVDYSYSRPSRRASAMPDFVMPSMRQPQPRIAVVVDTSGSMSDKELSQALAEIEGVLTAGGQTGVTVLSCDAAVHTTQRVFKSTEVQLMGGGGTSMTVGLRAAEALRPRPHVIILVTDCETDWPKAMRTPLIVARTSTGSPAPAWAKCVDVTP